MVSFAELLGFSLASLARWSPHSHSPSPPLKHSSICSFVEGNALFDGCHTPSLPSPTLSENNFSDSVVLQTHHIVDSITTTRCGLDVCQLTHNHHFDSLCYLVPLPHTPPTDKSILPKSSIAASESLCPTPNVDVSFGQELSGKERKVNQLGVFSSITIAATLALLTLLVCGKQWRMTLSEKLFSLSAQLIDPSIDANSSHRRQNPHNTLWSRCLSTSPQHALVSMSVNIPTTRSGLDVCQHPHNTLWSRCLSTSPQHALVNGRDTSIIDSSFSNFSSPNSASGMVLSLSSGTLNLLRANYVNYEVVVRISSGTLTMDSCSFSKCSTKGNGGTLSGKRHHPRNMGKIVELVERDRSDELRRYAQADSVTAHASVSEGAFTKTSDEEVSLGTIVVSALAVLGKTVHLERDVSFAAVNEGEKRRRVECSIDDRRWKRGTIRMLETMMRRWIESLSFLELEFGVSLLFLAEDLIHMVESTIYHGYLAKCPSSVTLLHLQPELQYLLIICIVVLISSASERIITATMEMLTDLFNWCSAKGRYTLVQADLIPQLILALNPQSITFAETLDIHTYLLEIVSSILRLATPSGLSRIRIEDDNGQQAVHKTVLQQVLYPLEKKRQEQAKNKLYKGPFALHPSPSPAPLPLGCNILIWVGVVWRSKRQVPVLFLWLIGVAFQQPSPPLPQHSGSAWPETIDSCDGDWGGLEDVVAEFMAVLEPCSLTTNTLPLPSLPLPHHPHPPTALCLSLTTHTLPLPSASPLPALASDHLCSLSKVEGGLMHAASTVNLNWLERMAVTLFALSVRSVLTHNVYSDTISVRMTASCNSTETSIERTSSEGQLLSVSKKAEVFQSLIATMKSQPVFDDTLETKGKEFLKSLYWDTKESTATFLSSFGETRDESLTGFVQSIMVLVSSPKQTLIKAAMEMLADLVTSCHVNVRLALAKTDLIPQLITTLNPQSITFAETLDIHTSLMTTILNSVRLATPSGLEQLGIKDRNEEQTVHETVLKQVLVPSEKYIWHLCVNRLSIIEGEQSSYFLILLTEILEISPYYQPTMDCVLHMPIFLAIPSCLTFFEHDPAISTFLSLMINAQWQWKRKSDEMRQTGKPVDRMLRMEGFEDVIEEKLQNDKITACGGWIVANSIRWNNLLGMNVQKQE
ncbi:hypothetical protein BLNAU_12114 [Blattamonas nauphoetae]|uniref:Uncharacterized protein n=1 Tax=Blattamonas nauphoetae TaxID=2049346 RepID=A0ABQ9XNM6_9EUKA|nr:hypothetical protein BLNAU_12114 [Blattamonas nauphoetae]